MHRIFLQKKITMTGSSEFQKDLRLDPTTTLTGLRANFLSPDSNGQGYRSKEVGPACAKKLLIINPNIFCQ